MTTRLRRLMAATLLTLAGAASASGTAPIGGRASVIDGDTLEVAGIRIRLHGLDAPESTQTCTAQDGVSWRCGQRAALALDDLIAGRQVQCQVRDKDRYGRSVAECFVGGVSINDWLVRSGWAVAYRRYSKDYVAAEAEAQAAMRNIWSGTFTPPDAYRRQRRSQASAP